MKLLAALQRTWRHYVLPVVVVGVKAGCSCKPRLSLISITFWLAEIRDCESIWLRKRRTPWLDACSVLVYLCANVSCLCWHAYEFADTFLCVMLLQTYIDTYIYCLTKSKMYIQPPAWPNKLNAMNTLMYVVRVVHTAAWPLFGQAMIIPGPAQVR